MTEPTATCYYRILQPMHFPVSGVPGEYLSVWPLPLNLWVLDRTGEWVVRRGGFEESKLWTELQRLEEEGVIRPLFGDAAAPLRHPLPTADVQSRPAFRVIRAG